MATYCIFAELLVFDLKSKLFTGGPGQSIQLSLALAASKRRKSKVFKHTRSLTAYSGSQ